jgi:hypothetical protein
MVENHEEAAQELERDVAKIVEGGAEIREKVATRTAEAMTRIGRGFQGLAGVATAALRGAIDGARGAEPRAETLREVVDGIGDGVSRAALAARLAFDEALGRGRQFAMQDLDVLRSELSEARRHVTDAVGRAFAAAGDSATEEIDALRGHASRAVESVGPALQAALDAAQTDPSGLARGAAQASVGGAREAVGSLFAALGGYLRRAGDELRGR